MLKILFLSANPWEASRIEVEKEFKTVRDVIKASRYRDLIDLERIGEVSVAEMTRLIIEYEPHILHFSGHGSSEGVLIFQDSSSQVRDVAELFRILSQDRSTGPEKKIRCVVLNACYSEKQASEIARHVDCVVGMSNAIVDEAAIAFSESFYLAIAAGKTVQTAFDLGKNEVARRGIPGQDIPRLAGRQGVDPAVSVLVDKQEYESRQAAQRAYSDFKALLDKVNEDEKRGLLETADMGAPTWIGHTLLLRDLLEGYGGRLRANDRMSLELISETSAAPTGEIPQYHRRLKRKLAEVVVFLSAAAGGAAGAGVASGIKISGAAVSTKTLAAMIIAGVIVAGAAAAAVYGTSQYNIVDVESGSNCSGSMMFPPLSPLVRVSDDGKKAEFSRLLPVALDASNAREEKKVYLDLGIMKHEIQYPDNLSISYDGTLIDGKRFPLKEQQTIQIECA